MFTHNRTVAYSEVSMDGHADAAQVADYMQDCSCWSAEGTGSGIGMKELQEMHRAWILASWQIVIDRYPEYNDQIAVSTWPYDFDSLYGYRNFEIKDQEGRRLAVANSQWIFLDTERFRPQRIGDDLISHYDIEPKAEMAYAPRRILHKEEMERKEAFTVPRSFIDTNQHMNNAQYIRAALEYIPEDFKVREIRVEYKNQAVRGDIMYPLVYEKEGLMKVVFMNDQNTPYAVIEMKVFGKEA